VLSSFLKSFGIPDRLANAFYLYFIPSLLATGCAAACLTWEDHISLSATVDNTTMQNRAAMLIASLLTYIYPV
jgi:hypothetical protein